MRHLFVLALAIVISGALLAQSSGGNEVIPECTPQDAQTFIELLNDARLPQSLSTLSYRLENDQKGNHAWVVDSVIMLRRIYERDILAGLPECSLIYRWRLKFESTLNGYGLMHAAGDAIKNGSAPDTLESRLTALSESIGTNSEGATEYFNALAALAEEAGE